MLDGSGAAATPPRILHVGCGGAPLPGWLSGEEVRLDIDPQHKPDIVASMTDIPDDVGRFTLVYSSHSLEHLYLHEVHRALRCFHRVLVPGGLCIAIVPDLQGIEPTDAVVYESPAGPVTGRDMFYGAGWLIEQQPPMAHHTGFVKATLVREMERVGFKAHGIRAGGWNLIGIGEKVV